MTRRRGCARDGEDTCSRRLEALRILRSGNRGIVADSAIGQLGNSDPAIRELTDWANFQRSAVVASDGNRHAVNSGMTPQELRDRADRFADRIIAFCRTLPPDALSQRIAAQLQDAGTSTAANYHAACRARSRAAFVAKLSIVVEEADESLYWLHRLQKAGLADEDGVESLRQEASELVAIFVASQRTATRR